MVEGRFIFGTILVSISAVVLIVILGLRDLSGTLGGSDSSSTLLLSMAFLAFMVVASLLSFTSVLSRRR